MKKIVVAIDSFKGCASSAALVEAVEEAVKEIMPACHVCKIPIADGGEGTVDALIQALQGERVSCRVEDPLRRPIEATYGWVKATRLAVIEMAAASGLPLLRPEERDVMRASTRGVGQLITDAIHRGARHFLLGIGGSATNDGGIGLLIPLGFKFLDKDGNDIEPNGAGIAKLAKIVPPAAKISTKFIVATDISTPLLGENGAALQFAEQKGATREEAEQLEANMKHLVDVAQKSFGKSLHDAPGAGSAGGCGYGLMTFLDAKRVSGFDLFAKYADLESHIKSCNILITGEGKFDKTDAQGKGPYALAKLAAKYKKPVWIFCGSADVTDKDLANMKLSDVKIGQILPMAPNMVEAQNRAPKFLSHLARDFVAALK